MLLSCDELDTTGATVINGGFNICPRIQSTALTPAVQSVGDTIALSAIARDLDLGPAPLSFSWSSSDGALSNASSATSTFTCAHRGTATMFDASTQTLVDSYAWASHATTTYGRCPNGTGPFVTTLVSTKGTPNSCAP